jgi:hypothetical protein
VPSVSTELAAFDHATGKPVPSITTAGEMGTEPLLRTGARATAARLVTVSRDGLLQGFAIRVEPPAVALDTLPGERAMP